MSRYVFTVLDLPVGTREIKLPQTTSSVMAVSVATEVRAVRPTSTCQISPTSRATPPPAVKTERAALDGKREKTFAPWRAFPRSPRACPPGTLFRKPGLA